jgi:MFS family permease
VSFPPASRRAGWVTLVVVFVSVTLFPLSLTGAAVATPGIASDLGASVGSVQWVINGYNLMFAALMLAAGSLADRVGRRLVFTVGTGLFGIATLTSAFSSWMLMLVVARGLAGIGAAAALTRGGAILAARFEGPARVRAFGLFGTALGAGLALGPLVSGALIARLGWRGVFAVPAFAGILVALLSGLLDESRHPGACGVDWVGTVTFTAGLFLLILALVEAPSAGWASALVIGSLAGCAVFLAGFVLAERSQAAPMFDLNLLRHARFLGVLTTTVTVALALIPLLVFMPTYFAAVEGYSAFQSGAVLLMFTIPTLVVPALAAPAARFLSLRVQLFAAMIVGWRQRVALMILIQLFLLVKRVGRVGLEPTAKGL